MVCRGSQLASPMMEPSLSLQMYLPPAVTCQNTRILRIRLKLPRLPPQCHWREQTWVGKCLQFCFQGRSMPKCWLKCWLKRWLKGAHPFLLLKPEEIRNLFKTCPNYVGLPLQGCFTPAKESCQSPGNRPSVHQTTWCHSPQRPHSFYDWATSTAPISDAAQKSSLFLRGNRLNHICCRPLHWGQ